MSDHQQPLDLPEYHGRKPVGMRTSLNGAGNRVQREHAINDRVILVIEAKVKKAGHEETDDGLIYTETLKVADLFEVDGKAGSRLIAAMRHQARVASDAVTGNAPLPDLGDEGYTDASGIVLTPAELAEVRNDPAAAVLGSGPPSVVVVYEDDTRDIWPDDFEDGTPRPTLGQRILGDDGTVRIIDTILDGDTGEPLDTGAVTVAIDGYDAVNDAAALDEIEAWNDPADADDDPDTPEADDPAPDDDAPPFDTPDDDVPAFDAPADTADEEPITAEAAVLEAELPTAADFEFVDKGIPELRDDLEDVMDADILRRLVNAEKQGRGRGLKYRKGALDAIHARLETVERGVRLKVVK